MIKTLCALLVTLALAITPAHGADVTRHFTTKIVAQTKRVHYGCFPGKLMGVLNYIQRVTKRKVIVTSGHRDHGRSGSLHRSCKAADIRVQGYSTSRLRQIARSAPGIGGIGIYRRQPGLLHVDVGPKREWTH